MHLCGSKIYCSCEDIHTKRGVKFSKISLDVKSAHFH